TCKLVVPLDPRGLGARGTVPRTTLPSMNVTVPVGTPIPGARTETTAVKVTNWPATAGLADEVRATAVAARLTVRATAAEVLFARLPVPAKEAVNAALPTPSGRVRVAWPAALTGAVPSTEVPARKMTVPVGPPAAAVTAAVSVTGWPKTAAAVDVRSVV